MKGKLNKEQHKALLEQYARGSKATNVKVAKAIYSKLSAQVRAERKIKRLEAI